MFDLTSNRLYLLWTAVILLFILFSPAVNLGVPFGYGNANAVPDDLKDTIEDLRYDVADIDTEDLKVTNMNPVPPVVLAVTVNVESESVQEVVSKEEQKIETIDQDYEREVFVLAHAIHAEAAVDGWEGMTAVAEVIQNRVRDPWYPDTIEEVVYQVYNGTYQFCVVRNGRIDLEPNDLAWQVAREVMERDENILLDEKVLFFCMQTTESPFMKSRILAAQIGTQNFYY